MDERDDSAEPIARLNELAEFRYLLRTFLNFSETASEALGIAAQQYQLMQVIEAAPAEQLVSISYLADRMILRHNSMVELVDRAERAGLVQRGPDENDLRRSLVHLTPQGHEILAKLVSQHLKELDRSSGAMLMALEKMRGTSGR